MKEEYSIKMLHKHLRFEFYDIMAVGQNAGEPLSGPQVGPTYHLLYMNTQDIGNVDHSGHVSLKKYFLPMDNKGPEEFL